MVGKGRWVCERRAREVRTTALEAFASGVSACTSETLSEDDDVKPVAKEENKMTCQHVGSLEE